jgi:outer membrane lipoprotein-sorting protein
MHRIVTSAFSAVLLLALMPGQPARADDLAGVLAKLDAAAKDFHTTTATVEVETIQTDPIPDTDLMDGVAYYDRNGSRFEMSAHFHQHNGRPTGKIYMFSGGVFKVSDTGKENDAKTYTNVSKYQGYLMLGFGASGKELQEKWDIKYLGAEKIDGVTTDKLELVARDPAFRKNIPKVTIWLDTARAVSVKQSYDEGEGQTYVCHYTNIKVNQPLPKGAFSFDTGK